MSEHTNSKVSGRSQQVTTMPNRGPGGYFDDEQPTARGRDAGPVCIIVHGRARPNKIEEAKEQLMKIVHPIRENPDNLDFRVYQDRDDPQSFILWERWISEEAVFAHGKRDYMSEYMAKKDEIFEKLEGDFLKEIHPSYAASVANTLRPVVQSGPPV